MTTQEANAALRRLAKTQREARAIVERSQLSHEQPISLALACFLVGFCGGVIATLLAIGIAHGGLQWVS